MRTGAASTPDPVTVGPNDSVVHAAGLMRLHHIGDVVVVDAGRPVGLLTDRDIVVGAVAQAADRLEALTVGELLDLLAVDRDPSGPSGDRDGVGAWPDEVFVADADDPMWKTLQRMRDHGVRRMPVVENGHLVGIFTVDDAIGLVVEQLDDIASLISHQVAR